MKKQKAKDSVRLGELDYLRLVAARGRVNDAVTQGNAEIDQAKGIAEQRVQRATLALNDAFRKIAPKYGIDASRNYRFDDARRSLVLDGTGNNGGGADGAPAAKARAKD